MAHKLADDDVTDLGEELADLHVDTLGSDLDDQAAHHYRRALEHYEQAKDKVRDSTTARAWATSSTSHNKKSLAEATVRQTKSGENGPYGRF